MMKKKIFSLLLTLTCLLTMFVVPVQAEDGIDMYRLYNPNSGEHFYTSNTDERDNLRRLGWNYEGIGWVAPSYSEYPVYRLYNQYGGEHHYTMSIEEKNNLMRLGWSYEGIGWYSANPNDSASIPLKREYNPNAFANNHNYTTGIDEHNMLISIGWKDEGNAWYAIGYGRSDSLPDISNNTTSSSSSSSSGNYYTNNNNVCNICVDGTPASGNPDAKGRANACYGHQGFACNH